MARTTPRIEGNTLILPMGKLALGSQQWYAWLADERNSSFSLANEAGSFTARRERRKRGGWYWIAYRSQGGQLFKTYLGRSEDLTSERLHHAASQLAERKPRNVNYAALIHAGRLSFAPPLLAHSMLLARNELLARLDESLHLKLLLITAPAGFGKTTLLSQWYEMHSQDTTHAIIWITLDERDNDPVRFWNTVWNALQTEPANVNFSVQLYSTPHMSIDSVLAALTSTWDRHKGGTLILDDYHTITNQAIHQSMDILLAQLPQDTHIIISSRSEPPLALGRARIYGELSELSVDDLRFKPAETEHFLRDIAGITLADSDLTLLKARTEGWIAGLHLIGLALRNQPDPGETLMSFTGSQQSLFAYFAQEVFAHQPADVQHFLLSTALLTEFTPPLCTAMLDNAEQISSAWLEQLAHSNIFITPLDRQRYRYHALFSEFLREKLARNSPELIPELHLRASRWYEQQGANIDAIEHALAAQDEQRASRLIAQIGEEILWKKGEVKQLLNWLQRLTKIETHSYLNILYAWALLLSGHDNLTEVERRLQIIEQTDEQQGEIAALRARIAAFHNDIAKTITFSQQALRKLPRERALLRADVAFGLAGTMRDMDGHYRMLSEALNMSLNTENMRTAMFASRYMAVTCSEQGKLAEAEAILHQALHMTGGGEHTRVPVTGIIHIGLAELFYEHNELAPALHHASLGAELGKQSGEIKAVLAGHCTLARIFAAQGEYELAWQETWLAERVALSGKVTWMREDIAQISISLALNQGQRTEAERALRKLDIDPDCEQAPQAIEQRLMLAQLWLAEEKYGAVIALLEMVVSKAHTEKRIRIYLVALTLQAIAQHGLHEKRHAARLLNEALKGAGPGGFIRLYLDLGAPLLHLLQDYEPDGSVKSHARRLLEASGQYKHITHLHAPQKNRKLSEREYEILQLLATGMSNQEIADQLIVAASTVKVHVRHICQKLDVQRRIQAVARARELGLLT